ncbi:MAG: hypothetical protein MZV70_66055 [Desulfobacterales bacterium]|nr:hypothetical protein [Desulfobacterales bacterium]
MLNSDHRHGDPEEHNSIKQHLGWQLFGDDHLWGLQHRQRQQLSSLQAPAIRSTPTRYLGDSGRQRRPDNDPRPSGRQPRHRCGHWAQEPPPQTRRGALETPGDGL